tara:strand:- start:1215 stop:2501 length:1287 start_codon:yes stop_codon:yes gene_type:complete
MKVGIIGSGGREHSICYQLKKSKKVREIYCFPGNAGTSKIATNIDIPIDNFDELKKFCVLNKIQLLIVGPEKPLVEGIVDYFENTDIKIFGPNKIASQLEGSKIFTKELCEKKKIPTAKFKICKNLLETNDFIQKAAYPLVVKADGLASGKGVYICKDISEAKLSVEEIFNGKFGRAEKLLIEEFLDGEEMSYFIISDGKTFKHFGSAQDHKRVLEGDKGKNTGGMGCYSPSRLLTPILEKKIIETIVLPTISGLKDLGTTYQGFLYLGLMIKDNCPYLIEFNVRMGDPECQTILPKLKTDLFDLFWSCCSGNLNNLKVDFEDKKSICIVLCSKGYPDKIKKRIEIKKLRNIILKKNYFIFHAGTILIKEKILSNGGRVLNFVSISDDVKKSRENIIKLIEDLNWENGFFRKDIAYKIINNENNSWKI